MSKKWYRTPFHGWIWFSILVIWLFCLCILPDPRPLGAPDWSVKVLRSIINVSEPSARFLATVLLRGIGIGMIGVFMSMSLQRFPMRYVVPSLLVGTASAAIVVKIINLGYLPLRHELLFIVTASTLGVLAGLSFQRSRAALAALVGTGVILFAWGTATGISDQLDEQVRMTGLHVLENADQISSGDAGFIQVMEAAFAFSHENAQGTDAVDANQAAILALGVILGDDLVAQVGRRKLATEWMEERALLRGRVTAHGRNDLSMHFWVSAALTVLSDEERALTVGIVKELKDSTSGGSGFSFVDMAANKAGIRFAAEATRNVEAAEALRLRIQQGAQLGDFLPDLHDLPEELSSDQFRAEYGGAGGRKTRAIFAEIGRRLDGLYSQ